MRLLIITQVVDSTDTVLGFFHRWIVELARHCESIHVICLRKGTMDLPQNVTVHSLGKEQGSSRFQYLKRFFGYVWKYRKEYDVVFVHMNSEYVVLGGWLFRLLQKKIALWFNHIEGTWKTWLAGKMSDWIFCTSRHSFFSSWPRARLMPAGINTDLFRPSVEPVSNTHSIVYVGRISRVKNIHVLVEAVKKMYHSGYVCTLTIVGDAISADDKIYAEQIKQSVVTESYIIFLPAVKHSELSTVYSQYQVCVNLTNSGSFDKTILEAMACGRLVLVANKSFEKIVPPEALFDITVEGDLEEKLKQLFALSEECQAQYANQFVEYVRQEHSLDELILRLYAAFQEHC